LAAPRRRFDEAQPLCISIGHGQQVDQRGAGDISIQADLCTHVNPGQVQPDDEDVTHDGAIAIGDDRQVGGMSHLALRI